MDLNWYSHSGLEIDQAVMVMKGYSTLTRSQEQETHHQMGSKRHIAEIPFLVVFTRLHRYKQSHS